MKVKISPSRLSGVVYAPASKSIMQRAVAAALLAEGVSKVYNPALSEDCEAALEVAEALGAEVSVGEDHIAIKGGFAPTAAGINTGESGLGVRMFTSIVALHDQPMEISGRGGLMKRPIDFFETTLPLLGVKCTTNGGKLPMHIEGPLKSGEITVDGSLSSQYLTGLLMALPTVEGDSLIHVKDLKSIPYISMTLEVMAHFGVFVKHDNFEHFHIKGGQTYSATDIGIEGDWSGGAFLLAAGAICGDQLYEVKDLTNVVEQADSRMRGAMLFAGAKMLQEEGDYKVKKAKLRGFNFDATDCPDLFPPLAALAAFCEGKTTITGTHRLTHKESNRALTLQSEFGKAGIKIDLEGDDMIVHPGPIQAATLHAHGDHRIAMAAALLGLGGADIVVENAESVAKSYPDFWQDIAAVGGRIQEVK